MVEQLYLSGCNMLYAVFELPVEQFWQFAGVGDVKHFSWDAYAHQYQIVTHLFGLGNGAGADENDVPGFQTAFLQVNVAAHLAAFYHPKPVVVKKEWGLIGFDEWLEEAVDVYGYGKSILEEVFVWIYVLFDEGVKHHLQ